MCLGAGYLGLGAASSGLAALILWCLIWSSAASASARQARLIVAFETGSGIENRVIAALAHAGYKIAAESRSLTANGECCEICYQLRWYDDGRAALTPGFTDDLARERAVQRLEWTPARID